MDLSLDDIIKKRKRVDNRSFSQQRVKERDKSQFRVGINQKGVGSSFKKVRNPIARRFIGNEKVRRISYSYSDKKAFSNTRNRRNNMALIEDARLKIGRKISKISVSLNNPSATIPKPVDARMRIEARKSVKGRQVNTSVVLSPSPPVLKGILRHSLNTSYIDRDYVPDDDNDIDFSLKSHVKNYTNDTDDTCMRDMTDEDDYMDVDSVIDEHYGDNTTDIFGEDLHLLRRTVMNDRRKSIKKSILLQSSSSSSMSTAPVMKENIKYSDVKRTIENTNRPLKFQNLPTKSSDVNDRPPGSTRRTENLKPSLNSRLGKKTSETDGCKIVVSNLHVNVTSEDIKELFEDIGNLISAKVTRPGTVEVVYKLHKDALKAVDVYHNRQLDGQPMKCVLIKPSPSTRDSFPSKKKESNLASIQPDPNTIRKALFN